MPERYVPTEEIRKQAEKDRENSRDYRKNEKKKRKNRAALLLATALTTIGIGGMKIAKGAEGKPDSEPSLSGPAEPGEIAPEEEQREAVEGMNQQDIQEDAQKEYERLVEEETEKQKAEIRKSLEEEE